MNQKIERTLGRLLKGTNLTFLGKIIHKGFIFLTTLLIIRSLTPNQYGVYTLGTAVMSVGSTIALMALNKGITRQISHYRKKEESKIGNIIGSTLLLVVISSSVISIIVYLFSDMIAVSIFTAPALSYPLKIFSLFILPSTLLSIFTAIFRAFGSVKEIVFFRNLFAPALTILLLSAVLLVNGGNLNYIIYTSLAANGVTCALFAVYTARRKIEVKFGGKFGGVGKDLLLFSLPLLGSSLMNLAFNRSAIFLLGFHLSSKQVALYVACYGLAKILPVVLRSFGVMYLPLTSSLHAEGLLSEVKQIYQITTKWIFSLTFPLFLVFFLFPKVVLNFLFGVGYLTAAFTLRILAVGMIGNVMIGLDYFTLNALGRTKLVFHGDLIKVFSNIALNLLFIPLLGIDGAGIAFTVSFTINNVYTFTKLYGEFGIHPFYENYLKLLGIAGFLLISFYLSTHFISVNLWMLPIFIVIYFGLYFLLLIVTKSFDRVELILIRKIEKKTGVDLTPIKKILKKIAR